MKYSAGNVSNLLWFIEMRETVRLLQKTTMEEAGQIIIRDNLYQQKSEYRRRKEFNCIRRRILALPEELIEELIDTDLETAKLITFISAMATDVLLFEFVYEVYREKLMLGDEELTEADRNCFFNRKMEQSDIVSGWSETARKKLQQTYVKYMLEAGLLQSKEKTVKKIVRPYIDMKLRDILVSSNMEKYLYALTGEQ